MSNWMIDVLKVQRSGLGAVAGLPWKEAVALSGGDGLLSRINHGYSWHQQDRASWKPPVDNRTNEELLYLPLNHAWLREVDGRAFLYLQNW